MDLITSLRAACGEGAVLTAEADRAGFETDWRRLVSYPALCVAQPGSTEEVAEVTRLCAAAGARIVPQGGNTGLVAGGVPVEGGNQVIVSLARMRRIRDIDIAGDSLVAEAGVTLQAVQDAAAAAGRLFPVSLGAEGTAQIGGLISTNAGGTQVLSYGSMRAQVLGLEVVLADGRVWHGLRALRKDNTGFDLKQIFIGAEGLLGIITAATLRLQPAVTARATALIGADTVAAAMEIFTTLRAAVGAGLTLCEFMSREAMELGAAHATGGNLPFEAAVYVLAEVSAHSTEPRVGEMLEAALADLIEYGPARDAVITQSERERIKLLHMREGAPEEEQAQGGAVKHDIAVPLGRLPEMVAAVEALVREKYPDCRLNIFGHLGDGNLHVNVRPPAGGTLADLAGRKTAITADIEAAAVALGGSFSAEHGIGQLRRAGMRAHKSDVELDLMRRVKDALDPDGRFNPGKLLP
jgi:FAD/FMN-containing dehydrogenase